MAAVPQPVVSAADRAAGKQGTLFVAEVESIRGIGALFVAWSHCGFCMLFVAAAAPTRLDAWFRPLVNASVWVCNARAALTMFFVISGFVLSLMLDSAPTGRSARGYGGFLYRRGMRVYPAHVASMLLFVPLMALTLFEIPVADPVRLAAAHPDLGRWFDGTVYGAVAAPELATSLLLSDNYYSGVTWSLRVELLASLFMPLFAFLSRGGRLPLDLGVLALLVGVGALQDAPSQPDSVFLYLPAFYLGCMVRTHGRRLAAAVAKPRWGAGAGLAVSYAVMVGPAWAMQAGGVEYWLVLDMSLGAFAFLTLVVWAPSAPVQRLLRHPVPRRLGRISYSFYLWHWLVLCAVVRTMFILLEPETLARWNIVMFGFTALTSIAIALIVADFSYRWIERPFMALGRGATFGEAFRPRRPAPAAPVAVPAAKMSN